MSEARIDGVRVDAPALTDVEILDLAQDFRVVERPTSYEPYETFDYVGFARAILARAHGVLVDADPVRAALEKLLRAEEKYVRDTGLPQPDDLIQDAVNEARAVLGWPTIGVPGAATPQDQAIYDSIANRYQRDRIPSVRTSDGETPASQPKDSAPRG